MDLCLSLDKSPLLSSSCLPNSLLSWNLTHRVPHDGKTSQSSFLRPNCSAWILALASTGITEVLESHFFFSGGQNITAFPGKTFMSLARWSGECGFDKGDDQKENKPAKPRCGHFCAVGNHQWLSGHSLKSFHAFPQENLRKLPFVALHEAASPSQELKCHFLLILHSSYLFLKMPQALLWGKHPLLQHLFPLGNTFPKTPRRNL